MPATQRKTEMRPTCAPFRQSRTPRPVTVIDPASPEESAAIIYAAIRSLVRHRGCLVYLYVSEDGRAFVLSDERPTVGQWMIEHTDWWRSCYTQTTTLADVEWEIATDR